MGTLFLEYLYIDSTKSMTDISLDRKNSFVSLTTLPDLAIANGVSYVRHRSLASVGSIYFLDSSLREYQFSTYTISNSKIIYEK